MPSHRAIRWPEGFGKTVGKHDHAEGETQHCVQNEFRADVRSGEPAVRTYDLRIDAMDRFKALQRFTRIVELGSFTEAASVLNLPRATATQGRGGWICTGRMRR